MLLAELEVWHSRPMAPTRRVALGRAQLPVDPAPGFGGLLLGGVVAAHIGDLDPDLHGDLHRLIAQIERGQRIPQPRLRHRFQTDRIGLARSRHRLHGDGETFTYEFDEHGLAPQHILGAVYATASLAVPARHVVAGVLHRAMRYVGPPEGGPLLAFLSGRSAGEPLSARAYLDPEGWALEVLGLARNGRPPAKREVKARFRELLREAHPDHGGAEAAAAKRIQDLSEARKILLGS